MDRMFFIAFGIFFFFVGVTFALNSISTITGLVVIEGIDLVAGSFAGVAFIFLGIILFLKGSKNPQNSVRAAPNKIY